MHLKKLEVQGFKTFAKKTALSFLPPKNGSYPITSVVGPNGSGKSNLADAIRWVLGEQSLKLLRGKKSEDVIFSGSEGRGRSGFAEVALTFDNHDGAMPIDYKEVTITRRLYRDGSSEYLLNNGKVRLTDIHLLLAQANVGQRSYSVIGQGMIDHILVSSPEERKAFFDDATGVKQFQIKRHDAILKLKRTLENLNDLEMLMKEIEPRLRSLKRQASRLEKRDQVEQELHELQTGYYGTLWWDLQHDTEGVKKDLLGIVQKITKNKEELTELEKKTATVENEPEEKDEGLVALQKAYRDLQKKRNENRDAQYKTEKEIELTKVRAQSNWSPLPLTKIIEEITEVVKGLKGAKGLAEMDALHKHVEKLLARSEKLVSRLQRPNPDDIKPDPALTKRLKELKAEQSDIEKALKKSEQEIDAYAVKERKVRTELIDMQRELRAKQSELHGLENKRNALDIQIARFEERSQSLIREMDEHMKDEGVTVRNNKPSKKVNTTDVYPEIQRLRYKLELIGGIDPEIIEEYKQTQERFSFLETQVSDLQDAIKSTEKIIKELDEKIDKQSKRVFADINKNFQKYFKILFNGGNAALVKLTRDDVEKEEEEMGVTPERVSKDTGESVREKEDRIAAKVKKHQSYVVGVDIQATPPGKRMKSLNLLSGGERALTSIALVSAIMAVNPAPFVVLDEVDAALDESNTVRFAGILEDLSKNSQFIIITHNRATMEKADILYGVTMGDDGVSNLLSVHLQDVAGGGTARR